jgi:hypothetical protein
MVWMVGIGDGNLCVDGLAMGRAIFEALLPRTALFHFRLTGSPDHEQRRSASDASPMSIISH